MIYHQFSDDSQVAGVCFIHEMAELVNRSIHGIDIVIIGNVIPIISQRRGIKGEKPDGGNPQVLQVIQFLSQSCEVSYSISITVKE